MDELMDSFDLQPTNFATGAPTFTFVPYTLPDVAYEAPADAVGDGFRTQPTLPYVAPATNGARDGSDTSFSFGQFGSQLKAGADSLLGVYKDFTQLQLAGQGVQIAQQNQKLSSQVASTQADARAQIAKSQAETAIAVAKAQAQQAINSAQMNADRAKGNMVFSLPSQKVSTYAAIGGLALAVYMAFKSKG